MNGILIKSPNADQALTEIAFHGHHFIVLHDQFTHRKTLE